MRVRYIKLYGLIWTIECPILKDLRGTSVRNMRISVRCLYKGDGGALFSLTWYDDLDDLSVSQVSPAEGAVVSSRVILSPGLGSREAPGHVVLEAGVGGGRQRPLQLVPHSHVRHGGSEDWLLVESPLTGLQYWTCRGWPAPFAPGSWRRCKTSRQPSTVECLQWWERILILATFVW